MWGQDEIGVCGLVVWVEDRWVVCRATAQAHQALHAPAMARSRASVKLEEEEPSPSGASRGVKLEEEEGEE